MMSGVVSNFLASFAIASIFGKDSLKLPGAGAPLLVSLLLLDAAITFLILWLLMSTHQETLAGMGLRRSHWKTNVILGLVTVPLFFIIGGVVTVVFQIFFPQYVLEKNPLTDAIRTPVHLALFLIAAIIAGGVKEELQRAFILRRFHRRLGGSAVGLVVWSLAFGAGHYVQGVQGVVAATIFGFVFGALYLMRGNLVAPITAHAVYDAAAVLLYWFVLKND
ncbi:MAG: CPBP family intramembrane metalloprotease [Acidobacteriota bacterium]|nr:CPBP family intramembrane metalloprotease [Acidobacteriota bacterium]